MQDCSLALSNLRDVSGRGAVKLPVPRVIYEAEATRRASAEKKLAEATKKNEQLAELRDKRNMDLLKAQSDNKFLVDSLKSEKALSKKSLDGQKALSKKELDSQKAQATSQMAIKKEAIKVLTLAKASLKREFDKQKRALDVLRKHHDATKVKVSDLNCTQSNLMRTRTDLQNEIKSFQRQVKVLTKSSDDQLVKKLAHELDLQKLKNEHKKLELDQTRERLEQKKAPINKASSVALSLENRMELESHKADCKRRQKDDDAARDKMKKDNKARDIQSNLGFAANMLQNTSNMNGGMWQQGSGGLQDVSR
jgi:hypothetical protein